MEIYLDKRKVRQIRLSASDAVEDGNAETLREDLMEVFADDEVEEIERRADSGDIHEFIDTIVEEWDLEDIDDLFELIETQLNDLDIDLKYTSPELDDDDSDDDDDDDDDVFDDDDSPLS